MQEKVVLINEKDEQIGLMDKQQAHEKGLLHRAFSVFLFNDKKETLLQQRAKDKYHSPLLWTNSCCSHPWPGESYEKAAKRRLKQEMGIVCALEKKFDFIYRADVGKGLIEHELDHVFVGRFNNHPTINPKEVNAYDWVSIDKIETELKTNPEKYTVWFKIIFDNYLTRL